MTGHSASRRDRCDALHARGDPGCVSVSETSGKVPRSTEPRNQVDVEFGQMMGANPD